MTTVSVCVGSACHLKGSYHVITALQQMIEEQNLADQIELKAVFCLKHCTEGISVMIDEDDSQIYSVSGDTAQTFFTENVLPRIG